MSKEILEQMEHDYKNAFPINVEWLLNYAKEKAERVKLLEERLEGSHKYTDSLRIVADEYLKQNNRYREAREEIEEVYDENYDREATDYEDGYLDGLDIAMRIIDDALEE
ncbi:MAG TPA: hypothetical protein VK105_20390 [Virgibacillus sp.]|nr:hypothetical protein [Virgibacillus sp.]HLR69453.1 hypothetical protein [Virgibacillus sp.]